MDKLELYKKAKDAYYSGSPIMSDEAFDILENEVGVGSVGYVVKGDKIKHPTRMLSLSKYQADKTTGKAPKESAEKWMTDITKSVNASGINFFTVTPKFDGNAANCIYANGELNMVLSRGDGEFGRDITDKISHKIPHKLPIDMPGIFEVRGEIIMRKSVFESKYASLFANPRNLVAGILGRDDSEMISDIEFIAYDAKYDGKYYEISYIEGLGFNGSHPVKNVSYDLYTDDFDKLFDDMKSYRELCDFPLDGFVLKVAAHLRNNFKENDHDPDWGKAIKFKPEGVTTSIEDIEWFIGKIGEYTPVAKLNPVDLDGSIISKVSLYNGGFIIRNNIIKGVNVRIVKSGDIIPQIVEVFESYSEIKPDVIDTCKHCGSKISFDGTHVKCTNNECDGKLKAKFFDGIKIFEIKGIGEVMAYDMFDSGIKNPCDIFSSNFSEKMLFENGMTITKNVTTVCESIKNIKEISLESIILSYGFDGVGKTTAKQIAKQIAGISYDYKGLEKEAVSGFDADGDKRKKIFDVISNISKDIKIIYPTEEVAGIGVEFTGSPKPFFKSKDELLVFLKANGFSHTKLSSAKYLLTDSMDSKSSKMEDAKKKGIAIYTYEEFLKNIKLWKE